MGEPTCLMQQQPFSYVAGLPNDNNSNEGNALHTLAQSISFGRFVSESLSWDKWSSFSQNRYVEEAERFSRPGSVAQKKAFFEAHYKNLAARKAAALLEQANAAAAASNNDSESAVEVGIQDNLTRDSGISPSNSKITVDTTGINIEDRYACHGNGEKLQVGSKSQKDEVLDSSNEDQKVMHNCLKVESLGQLVIDDNKDLNEAALIVKPLLKDFVSGKNELASLSKKKPTASSSKQLNSSRASKVPCSPAKPAALLRSKKENNATPISKKPATDFIDRRRLTPKSNHKSMNFTPVREISKITSTVIRKIDNSRATFNSKASRDCSSPMRTPITVPVRRESKHTLATPQSESRRAKTPLLPSASGSKSVRSKWHFLPTDSCSKFMSSSKNKSSSPSLSTPFKLRSEDRTARRKERLEEKFNSNQAQKLQLQTTLKEKAEAELKKLRQSLCFKARPLPKFYKETRKNQMEKVLLTRQQPPNQLRTPSPNMVRTTTRPPQRSSSRNGGSTHVMAKRNENTLSLSSQLRSTHENTSPNIPNDRATQI